MNVRYLFGSVAALPLLPLVYFQGKRIQRSVPYLPEAQNPKGRVDVNNDKALKLICIGESSMAGVGVAVHEEAFGGTVAKLLSKALNVSIEWHVYAKSGYTAHMKWKKLIPLISETEADLVIVMTGGNDAFTLNTPWSWQEDVRKIIHSLELKFGPVPVFFSNMPPIKDFPAFTRAIRFVIGNLVDILGDSLDEECSNYNHVYYMSETIRLKDWISRLGGKYKQDDFFSDGVHPSKLTYQTWAKEMTDFIIANY